MVSGIAVSSTPWRLWLQCLTLGRIRLRPQGPARRQKTCLRFEQGEVIRKNQTRIGSPPGECEWNPAEEAAEGARAESQSPGGGPAGRRWLLGSRLPLGNGPGRMWPHWHRGNQHGPAGRVLSTRPSSSVRRRRRRC